MKQVVWNEARSGNGDLRLCTRCVLPESFPGIVFDEEGVCNHCRREMGSRETIDARKAEYREKLDELIERVRGNAPSYDLVIAYSGGKDSSYTLKLMREVYDLRILALTFDNHFISTAATENIRRVTDFLAIDHVIYKPPWPLMKTIFRLTARRDIFPSATLLRASSICTACIGLVKTLVLKTALEMSIPLVAFGWSPGQAPIQSALMRTNPTMVRQTQHVLKSAFPVDMLAGVDHYFIPAGYYKMYADRFPYNVHPLAFLAYHEGHIKDELRSVGWKAPMDTDANSTNCLLNAFANQCHMERHNFHPYVSEIAGMVRQGIMTREEGLGKIYTEQNEEVIDYARERLDLR